MSTCIALLRAVNVGGRTLAMADLRRSLTGLGLHDIRTYLQSGNVVFSTGGACGGSAAAAEVGPASLAQLARAVEVRIERDLGPRVAVLLLAAPELAAIAAANPFVAAGGAAERSLHVTFLFTAVTEDDFGQASASAYSAVYESAFRGLELPAAEGERAVFVGSPPLATPVIYLHLPHGYGQTRLTNAYFERKLGTGATTRNWRTVTALAAMGAEATATSPVENGTRDEGDA